MSTENQNIDSQEIDLGVLGKKIKNIFNGFVNWIFRIILFIKRNIVVVSLLFVIGVVIGYFLDKEDKTYTNEIIVMPNFGSVDYLYDKVSQVQSKIEENDKKFLNQIGIKDTKEIRKIRIEPINDVYKFVQNNDQNFELLKLMAEDGNMDKILEDKTTSKNYSYHRITYETSKPTSENTTVKPLLQYFENSDYYKEMQKTFVSNINIKIKENDSIITQINNFLNGLSREVNNSRNDKLVFYNENTQLNDIIKTKENLVYDIGLKKVELINSDKIVKNISSTLNKKEFPLIISRMKVIIPLVLIGLFMLFHKIRNRKNI